MASFGVPGLPCSSSENDSSDSEGSGYGGRIQKKKRKSMHGVEESVMETSQQISDRKVNNVWGSVIRESILDSAMTSVGLERKERDVESYNYKQSLPVITSATEDSLDACDRHSTDNNLDPSDIARSADIDTDYCDDPFGPNSCPTVDIGKLESRFAPKIPKSSIRKRRMNEKVGRHRANKKERKALRSRLSVTEQSSVVKVVEELSRLLHESNTDLLSRAVTALGVKRALEFYCATVAVEAKGGMMTIVGDRRRTPGGVFFTLIKEDDKVTGEERDSIFRKSELEKQVLKVQRSKQVARRKLAKQKKGLQNAPVLPDSDDEEDTTVPSADLLEVQQLIEQRRLELLAGTSPADRCASLRTAPMVPHNTPDRPRGIPVDGSSSSPATADTEMRDDDSELEDGEIA